MPKFTFIFILFMLLMASCENEDRINNYASRVSFDISGRLLPGKNITCLDIDKKGNIYIASHNELYYSNGSRNKTYTVDFPILDIAIAPDATVWIGTNGGGLGHLTDSGITWYTVANSGLPRDYIRNVLVKKNGEVWFSSCAFKLGGLGIYDGNRFEFLTPENSQLNQNIIEGIEVDQNDNVYIATSGTVGKTNIYRISDRSWECLGDEKGTFYWVNSFTVTRSGIIYLVEDFSLSSSFYNSNSLFEYNDNKWQKVDNSNISRISFFAPIKADKRNFCWLAGYGENIPDLRVFNGDSWIDSPVDFLPDDIITTIDVDDNNNIWVGTYANGVFILNQ